MNTLATHPHAAFLDFDGTLGDYGIVPRAHVEALREARARGHKMFLCTGRPFPMVSPAILDELDGIVASAGCYVRVGATVLADHVFPEATARRTVEVLLENEIPFVLESAEGMFGNDLGVEHLEHLLASFHLKGVVKHSGDVGEGAADIERALRHSNNLLSVPFAKAVVWNSALDTQAIADLIGPEVRPMPNSVAGDGSHSGELQLWAVDKIDGLRMVAEHCGIPVARTIGCGDGLNDVKMLEGAGKAVVIEGSRAAVAIENPDAIVGPPHEGGIARAFKEFGLIAR